MERTIGVYKGRWRILLDERKARYSPEKLAKFSNVCAALHNICVQYRVYFNTLAPPDNPALHIDFEGDQLQNVLREGQLIRDNISRNLNNLRS